MTAPVVLRLGRQLTSLEYTTDDTERGSRIAPIAAQHAGASTFLGLARFRIVSSDSGAQTLILEDPEVPDSGPVGFGNQLVGMLLLREKTAETFEVVASDADTQELELDTWPGDDFVDGEWVEFREADEMVPLSLDHPDYIQAPTAGIGVKFRTIDRNTLVGLANLAPNAWLKTWTDPSLLPDGYTYSLQDDGLAATPPYPSGGLTFSKNTDPLYTEVGGQSLFFSAGDGKLITPPIPFMPTYAGQRMSVKLRVYLTQFNHAAAQIQVQLGLMLADGTIHTWAQPGTAENQLWMVPPTSYLASLSKVYEVIGTNGWGNWELRGVDISAESGNTFNANRVTAADLVDPTVLGFCVMIKFQPGAGRIEGYLDAVVMVPSSEAPADHILFGEFGRANTLWRDTNIALSVIAPPQEDVAVSLVDLYRLNPTLNAADELYQGRSVLLSGPSLGLSNVAGRLTEVAQNQLKKGDTTVRITTRRRMLAQFFQRGGGSSGSGTTGTMPTPPITPPVGPPITPPLTLSAPLLTLTLDDDNVPTVVANTTNNVNRVKFAWSLTGVPSDADVRAAASVSPGPFTATTDAINDGDTIWVAAFAYDVTSNAESLKGWTSISAAVTTPAIPIAFFRGGVGYKTGTWASPTQAGVEALSDAAEGNPVSGWLDQMSGDHHMLAGVDNFSFLDHSDAKSPLRNGDELRFGTSAATNALITPWTGGQAWWSAITRGEVMIAFRAFDGAPASDGQNNLWNLGRSGGGSDGNASYPDNDGNIYETFVHSVRRNLGAVPGGIDLEALTVLNLAVAPDTEDPNDRAWLNNEEIYSDHVIDAAFPQFSGGARILGLGQTSGYWNGWIKHMVVFDGILSDFQRTAWFDFLIGNTDVAPIDSPEESAVNLTYVRDGGDVIVTATARFASSMKIASSLTDDPVDDADVRAAPELTDLPFTATFPAPLEGETLHVAAFAYYEALGDLESEKATLDIPFGTEGGATSEAEYIVAASDASLPNARVGTDSDTVQWDFTTPGEASLHLVAIPPTPLDDLSGVEITSPQVGDVLTYEGTLWINAPPNGAFTPTRIPTGQTFTVPSDTQVLFKKPIRVQGHLVVRGELIEVR